MREILLVALVVVLCVVSLLRPRIGVLAYAWFGLMRPDVLAWSYGHYNYTLALAVCAIAGSLRYCTQFFILFLNPVGRALLVLQVPLALSVAFAVDPSIALGSYFNFLRTLTMVLLALVLTETEEHLRQLLLVIAISVGFLGFKFGLYGVIHGGVRYSMGHGGLMSDNNDLALALAMAIPLCWYARDMVRAAWLKLSLLILCFFTIAAIVMTYSRGGALSLITALLLTALQSRRKVLAMALCALIVASVVYLVKDTYLDRLATIKNPTEEPSAKGRIDFAKGAIACWKDYPLLGVGFGGGNFMLVGKKYMDVDYMLMVHNTYLQMLVDSGAAALLIYVGLLFGTILWLTRSAAIAKRETPGREIYPFAIQTSLCTFAVGSTFLSRVTFDMFYLLLVAAGAWMAIQASARAEQLQAIQVA